MNSIQPALASSLFGWDWGTTADWVSGIATIGAVIVALFANKMSSEERDEAAEDRDNAATERKEAAADRREAAADRAAHRRELEALQHERRADLARKVVLTVTPIGAESGSISPYALRDTGARLTLTNYSDLPIYNVQLGTDQGLYEVYRPQKWDSVPPGGTVHFDFPPSHFRHHLSPIAGFMDARNRGWLIDRYGHLRPGNNRIDFIKVYDRAENPFPDDPQP